jgi:uncharacterized membrane protein
MNVSADLSEPVLPDASLVSYTHAIYALHAASILIGVTSSVFIVTAFVFAIPSIIAVIMNYVRRSDVRRTYLDSHFSWQIRTFWWAVLWSALIWIISAPLIFAFGLGIITGLAGMGLLGLWIIYRVVRGWLRLQSRQPMYA